MKNTYGDWTVLKQIDKHYYLCRCKCGTERRVYEYNLKRGLTTSCGCGYRRPLTGKRFGKLVAIGEKAPGQIICRCDCGTEKVFSRSNLRTTRSCGCSTKQFMREKKITHGLSKNSEYRIWRAMLTRCHTKHHPTYKHYGARGITVCQKWHRFESFYSDMGPRPTSRHCLERIDNDAGYSPENCVWATYKSQQNNRRDNVTITYKGKTMTVAEWESWLGVKRNFLRKRLKRGWSVEASITTPTLRPNHPHWIRKKII